MISDPSVGRTRLEREARIHKHLRDLMLLFSRGVSRSLTLPAALQGLTPEIQRALGAYSVQIWMHDRRERQLTLTAITGGEPTQTPVSIDERAHLAAWGLRLDRPKRRGSQVAAPLRGWRRALGTLVIDRAGSGAAGATRLFPSERELIDFIRELAQQLSVGIENVQLLDEILRQRRLLEDTFNALVDLVAVVDRELRVVQTNDAFAARVGMKRDEVMRRPLGELVGGETLAFVEAADTWQGLVPATAQRVDDPELDGTFVLTATPLVSELGHVVGRVLVARDITRQARLEAERAALQSRLAQSEKLASLGQFVAGIAHEMNNPLQGVLGHLELLGMRAEARPVRRDLKHIYQEADRAAKIVHNLLVFTGSRKLVRRRIQVDRILSRVLASRKAHLAKHGITIDRRQGADLPDIPGDGLLLQQAFLNVVINAEHAVVAGGRARRIVIRSSTPAARSRVVVTIRDSGPGIAPDALPRIFDPFFTTKDVGQGTGLGLAITYGIIQDHGGTITVTTGRSGGALFRIELPAAGVGDRVKAHPPA